MINMYIFDDVLEQGVYMRQLFEKYQLTYQHLMDTEVHCVHSEFLTFLENIPHNNDVHNIYILDIRLGEDIDGLNLAKKIRERDIHGYIIFMTGHLEWVSMSYSYNVKALNYIYKLDPNLENHLFGAFETIHKELQVAIKPATGSKVDMLVYNYKNNYYRIPYKDILYVETSTLRRCLNIHTLKEEFQYPSTISKVSDDFPESFMQCHKSYVVNVDNMVKIQYDRADHNALFEGGISCPMTKKYSKSVMDRFMKGGN